MKKNEDISVSMTPVFKEQNHLKENSNGSVNYLGFIC